MISLFLTNSFHLRFNLFTQKRLQSERITVFFAYLIPGDDTHKRNITILKRKKSSPFDLMQILQCATYLLCKFHIVSSATQSIPCHIKSCCLRLHLINAIDVSLEGKTPSGPSWGNRLSIFTTKIIRFLDVTTIESDDGINFGINWLCVCSGLERVFVCLQ